MANGFDKDAAKKPAGKGKVITMILLAAVLGAVVFFHFNNAPQSADAASAANPNADLASIGSATDQIALLANSPTHDRLLHATAPAASTADLHTNPFSISKVWYDTLNSVKIGAIPSDPPPVKPIKPGIVPLPPINIDALKQTIKLQGIFSQNGHRVAFINDNVLSAGAMIDRIPGKVQIADILEDRIILQVPGYGDDGKFEISLSPKLNR